MKNLLPVLFAFCALLACNEAPKNAPAAAPATAEQDAAAITETIHGFYKWYFGGNESITTEMTFIVNNNGKLSLDVAKLDAWGDGLKKSGFVSDEYLANVKAYFKNCEAAWAKEDANDGPASCLEADLFTCYQDSPDLLVDVFTKSAFDIQKQGDDRAIATSKEIELFSFHLKSENGKWLLTNFGCVAAEPK